MRPSSQTADGTNAGDNAPALHSFVIPVYNEARCLVENVARVDAYLGGLGVPYELILVNDGSTDASWNHCRAIAADNQRVRILGHRINRGKGYAVRVGMMAARGAYRVFMDADLAVPVTYIADCLVRLRDGADVVIGSRHLPGACIKVPEAALRQSLGTVYRRLVLTAFGLRVTDITCGLKGFGAAATEKIFSRLTIDRWGYDAEILFLAQKLGLDIREIPVHWYHSFDSDVRIVKDSVRTFVEMVQICMRYTTGRYRIVRR